MVVLVTGFLQEGLPARHQPVPVLRGLVAGRLGAGQGASAASASSAANAEHLRLATWWTHAALALLSWPTSRSPRPCTWSSTPPTSTVHDPASARHLPKPQPRLRPRRLPDAGRLHLEGARRPRRLHQVRTLPRRLPGPGGRRAAVAPRPRARPAAVGRPQYGLHTMLDWEERPAADRPVGRERRNEAGRRRHQGEDALGLHHLHGLRRGLPGGHRARLDHRPAAPGPGRRRADGGHPPGHAAELRHPGQQLREVVPPAHQVDQRPRLQDQGRPQGARPPTCGSSATSPASTSGSAACPARWPPSSTTPASTSGSSTRTSATPATTSAASARRACSRCSSSRTWPPSPRPSSTRSSPPIPTRSTRCATSTPSSASTSPSATTPSCWRR